MLAVIRSALARLPITMGTLYWVTAVALWHQAGMPSGWMGLVGGFIVGLPFGAVYVWLFHMGKEEEPTPDA